MENGKGPPQTLSTFIELKLSRDMSHRPRLKEGQAVRQSDHGPRVAARASGVGGQLAQRVDLRPAQVIALADAVPLGKACSEAARHVLHVHRLESRPGTGEQEQRQPALQPGEDVQEPVLGPEDHRRPECRDREIVLRREHPGLAVSLGAQVLAGALGMGVQGAHVQEARDPFLLARFDDLLRQFDVNARKFRPVGIAPPAVEDANQVRHRVAAGHELHQRFLVVHVGLDHVHRRQKDQVLRPLSLARGHHDEMPGVDELAHEMPADEAAAADNQNPAHGCRKERTWRKYLV